MNIIRSTLDTRKGPADSFTGDVYIDTLAPPTPPARNGTGSVHVTLGARTARHTDQLGQTIYITQGVGLCAREGGPVEFLHPGDQVYFERGENQWDGTAPNRFMVHIALQKADESASPVTWGRHVTDEEYNSDRAEA